MSEFSKNQLVSRRSFFQRSTDAARLAGVGVALGSFGIRARSATAGRENPWAYDDSAFRRTDPKFIHYHEIKRFRSVHQSPRCFALGQTKRFFIGAGKHVTEYTLDGEQVSEIALSDDVKCLAIGEDGFIFVGLRDHLEIFDSKGPRKSVWEGPGKKTYLTGIAVSGANVFVADAGNRVVLRYDRGGKLKCPIGEKNEAMKAPGFIVPSPFFDVQVAPDGLLRVTNPGRHRVEAYTFDGDLEFAWGNPGASIQNFCGCCNPIKLAMLRDGRVVTFEKGIPRVKVYSPEGVFQSVVAGAESFVENSRVCGPNDCTLGGLSGAVDESGRVYILDLVAADVRVMERKDTV